VVAVVVSERDAEHTSTDPWNWGFEAKF
jgi:hypothetical protein